MSRRKQLGESKVVAVRLPLSMVVELESLASKNHKNRSIVIRELLMQALGENNR